METSGYVLVAVHGAQDSQENERISGRGSGTVRHMS